MAKPERPEGPAPGTGPGLEGILRTAPDGLWMLDMSTRFVEVNDAICAMLGYTRDEMLAMRVADVEVNESDEVARRHAEKILRDGVDRFASRLRRKDGTLVDVEVSAGVLSHGGGRIVAYLRDVSAMRRAAREAEASERRFRDLLDLLPDGAIVFRDGRIVMANRAAVRLHGATRAEQIVGRPVTDFLSGESLATAEAEMRRGAAGLEMGAGVVRIRGVDGVEREAEAKGGVVEDELGSAVQVVFRDVAERRRVEAELRDREAKLRSYFNAPHVGIAITDPASGFVEVNDHYCQMLGYTRDELAHRSWRELTHPGDVEHDVDLYRRLASGEFDGQVWEKRYVRKDGSVLPVLISVSATRHADGKLKYVVAISQDISERKRAEEALRDTHRELQRHVASTPLAVIEWDGGRRVTRFSGRAEEIFGWRAAEVVGRHVDEVPWIAEGDRTIFRALMRDAAGAARPQTVSLVRNLRKDGALLHCEWHNSTLHGPDGKLSSMFSLVQDVTAREKAKAALQASEARFRALADAAPVGVFQGDLRGDLTFLNAAGERLMGLSGLEALGKGWVGAMHPEDRERVAGEWAAAFVAERDFSSQYRFLSPAGRVTWIRGFAAPMRDAGGTVTGYVGVLVDVTDEKAAQQQLGAASRLAAMGTLVAGVGHEINNPLAVAMASDGAAVDDLRALQRQIGGEGSLDRQALGGQVAEILDSVEGALAGDKRIARIVQDLVALGRPDARRTTLKLREVVDAALRWLPGPPGKAGAIAVEDAHAPDVVGQPGQLAQVVIHLVTNAGRSGRPGQAPRVVVHIGPGAPGHARLEVRDDGVGMAPEQGTGPGLTVCQAIVAEHGGTISVTSVPGQGTTYAVELPAAAS